MSTFNGIFSILYIQDFMQLNPLNHTNDQIKKPEHQLNNDYHKEQNHQYFLEYCRLYKTAYNLSIQLKHLFQTKQKLMLKLNRFQKKTEDFRDDIRGQPQQKKRRVRKPAEDVQRSYYCSVKRCEKAYGSEGSLKQHIKLKHPQLYREQLQNRYGRQNNEKSQHEIDQ